MTRLDLEAIRARCDAATKGPWRVDGNTYDEDCNEHLAPYGLEGPNERMIWSSGGGEYSHPDMATAQFIAHTRADIPALLAYIDELVRERDEARAQLAAIDTGSPCDGHRHCCADRRKLAEELLRVRAERDEAVKACADALAERITWYQRGREEALKEKP